MKYKHLTREQRYAISRLLANGISQKQIALSIHVSPSTVCREIKRNFSKHKYSASGAQEWDDVRKERLLSNHAIKPTIKRQVLYLLQEYQWSPKQISGYLAKQDIGVSHTAIYNWVWEDKRQGGNLYKNLRHQLKHRTRHKDKWIPIKDRIPISQRPKEADGTRFGDWEMDTIVGKGGRGAIVTLVERSTDYMMMKRLPKGKNAMALAKMVKKMLEDYQSAVLSITTDNGTEFAEHKRIARQLHTTVYFTDPYSSWQKGNIENTNKLIRQYIPKNTEFNKLDDEDIREIQLKINRRPREKLNFDTPSFRFFKNFSNIAL